MPNDSSSSYIRKEVELFSDRNNLKPKERKGPSAVEEENGSLSGDYIRQLVIRDYLLSFRKSPIAVVITRLVIVAD